MEKLLRTAVFAFGFLMVLLCVQSLTTAKFTKLQDSEVQTSAITAKDRTRQLDCLARNIYYEAGSEPFEGKVAVAQVTMNRADSGRFPSDVCAVVQQKTAFIGKVVCQFSWFCESASLAPVRNRARYDESYEVAKKVLLEGFRLPSLEKAIYYHADYVSPNWNKTKITKIGHHIFYKD